MEKPAKNEATRRKRAPRDPEKTLQRGMSLEGADVDAAETMASTGNAEGSLSEVSSGTATGLGLDRGVTVGTGGLAAGEDRDDVAAGDWFGENLREGPDSLPERSVERFGPGEPPGWQRAADLEDAEAEFEEEPEKE